ncbi:uncharacterized protein BO72DRAFT_214602 [Aspergillus fijiensis CBS 313.89]|uniref:Uncharacterized protein n=1 Tax=Aspergillus fijiensis CBS 313.89 TaxID=1448319 RepID=A0A8G1RKG7_9EURO|nr:uncharacterized protein BO72DRAFT_214602 [Aspergillus fijiensis CBS 313.89]RAK74067.1 hypothetical protein BO72DRAFT_214602 [Aspergillus fijiensis CBS 313.89]
MHTHQLMNWSPNPLTPSSQLSNPSSNRTSTLHVCRGRPLSKSSPPPLQCDRSRYRQYSIAILLTISFFARHNRQCPRPEEKITHHTHHTHTTTWCSAVQ